MIGYTFSNFLHKLIKTQFTTTITLIGLLIALLFILLAHFGIYFFRNETAILLTRLNFPHFLLNGILGLLLFSGALNIKLSLLNNQKWEILLLSFLSTILSVILIGFIIHFLLSLLLIKSLPIIYCLLFGAIISPTDPISVLAILKKLRAPKKIEIQIEGESLFNDGIGLVIFVSLSYIAFNHHSVSFISVASLFLKQVVGGVLFGICLGFIANYLTKIVKINLIHQLIIFLIPTLGFIIANLLSISSALAMVAAGIIIGNITIKKNIHHHSKKKLYSFYSTVEFILNGVLFIIMGLYVIDIEFNPLFLLCMILAIFTCLLSRCISVVIPFEILRMFKHYNQYSENILIWGGVRGALGLAMLLSIPVRAFPHYQHINLSDLLFAMTYSVIIFSILIQGSTISYFIKKSKSHHI